MTDTTETDSIAGLPPQKNDSTTSQKPEIIFHSAEEAINYMHNSADHDKYEAGILPSLAHESLKYCSKLLNSQYKHFIVVDKDKMKVLLFDRYGRIIRQYGMAGSRNYGTKHKKADSRTPEGFFSAEGIYNSQDWEFVDDNGVKHPGKGVFGPKFIRVKNPVSTQIGIHGTSSPRSIGRRTSHGCIRLNNENILDLVKYVEVGMPIIIIPGPHDRKINEQEGSPTVYFNTGVEPYKGAHQPVPSTNRTPDKCTNAAQDSLKATPEQQPTTEPEQQPVTEPEQQPATEPQPQQSPATPESPK